MPVKVTKSFRGVPDGEAYPRTYQVGDEVTGDLAAVALKEKWAVSDQSAAKEPVKPVAPAPQVKAPVPDAPATAVQIPADWKTMKAPALVDLAKSLGSDAADAASAQKFIIDEVAKRAAAPKA